MKGLSTLVELSLIGLLVFCGQSRLLALPTKNPYAEIPDKNVFKLRVQPDTHTHEEPPKPPLNIKLSGFVKHATQGTRVLLAEVPKNPKDQMKFYNLGVGEQEDGVEVVRIHPGQDAVDVVIDGVPEVLTVKSNSFLTGLYDNKVVAGVRR
jgi:hypothetical protein